VSTRHKSKTKDSMKRMGTRLGVWWWHWGYLHSPLTFLIKIQKFYWELSGIITPPSSFFQPQQQTQPDKAFEPQVKLVGFRLHKSWVGTFEPRTFSGPRVQKVSHQPQGEWWHILSHILQTATSWGRSKGLSSDLFFWWICVKKGGCKSYKGLVFWENVRRPGGKNIESTIFRPDLLGLGFRV
jgi:hypothetical protein